MTSSASGIAHTSDDRSVQDRYAEVCHRVAAAAKRGGRRESDIFLVAVTKYADPEQIRTLIDLGHKDFGENKVQNLMQRAVMVDEYLARLKVLPHGRETRSGVFSDQPRIAGSSANIVRWHMIGHVQRNKSRKIIDFVRLVHSVDSLRLAEELQAVAVRREMNVEVLIQVNCSGEEGKFGCPLPAVPALVDQISTMMNVKVRGLMTMAPYSDDPEKSRPVFSRCKDLFEEMQEDGVAEGRFNLLSMGMSGDYEVALSEGANIVRIGSAIFGVPSPDLAIEADELDDES